MMSWYQVWAQPGEAARLSATCVYGCPAPFGQSRRDYKCSQLAKVNATSIADHKSRV